MRKTMGLTENSIFSLLRLAGPAILAIAVSSALPARAENYVAISSGHVVGHLVTRQDGGNIIQDFAVKENGRGPSSHEVIQVDPDGLPTKWHITGTSLVGAPKHEDLSQDGNCLKWDGDADQGSVCDSKRLYLANDASPWALGLYARAALKAPDHQIDVAPKGILHIEDVGPTPGKSTAGRIYRLSGLWMEPRYVALAHGGDLLAAFGGDNPLVLRADIEASAPALLTRLRELQVDRLRALQMRLAHRYDVPIQIQNVHVFDARSGMVGPLQIVTVFRDRITGILPDVPENRAAQGDAVIDGGGGTLIPGLRDMHSHTSLESGLFNLAAGVTSTRDMGNDNHFLLDLIPRLEDGELGGPRVTPNGFVEGVSPFSATNGFLASTLDDALKDIRWYADRGYWQLKVYNSINPAWVKPMAAEAHRLGMGVTGHIPAFTTADQAIRDGYDEVAHINQLMFQWVLKPGEDTRTTLRIIGLNRFAEVDLDSAPVMNTLALMREHNTVLDTTVSTQERLALSRAGRAQRGEWPYLDHVPIDYQRYRKRDLVPTKTRAEEERYEKATDVMVALVGRLHAQGTRLMPGTDDPYGFPLHRELELYVMAGITPAETLSIDVLGTAKYLKQDQELGTIERGKLADMVLLPGDPTKDISQVRRGRLVMRGGIVYLPNEIYQALNIEPFSTPPRITTPKPAAR